MIEITYKRWVLRSDVAATRAAYRALEAGGPEGCGCITCRNYVPQRHQVYPPEVLTLFDQLGVDGAKEVEVYHICVLGDTGLHQYGGWMHFVGEIISGRDAKVPAGSDPRVKTFDLEQAGPHFQIGFTAETGLSLIDKPFADKPLVQIEFTVDLPWILDAEDEPER